jgi:hypothetical protein
VNSLGRSALLRFRSSGRAVLSDPANASVHSGRVLAATELAGSEPLQGALVDMFHACTPDADRDMPLLNRSSVRQRLSSHVVRSLHNVIAQQRCLPRVHVLATRWCVLVTPSLDVPRRAMLCSVDDAKQRAARAMNDLGSGVAGVEDEFLTHCVGANDVMAFMLVRRELGRQRYFFSSRWDDVTAKLEKAVQT